MSTSTSLADLKKTSKMVASQAGIGQVKTFFESQRATLAAVLPRHVSPDRMLKIALGALRTTPKLMGCTVESLMGAVVQCSQLGLEPNTPLGHAYLIPFEKRRKQGNEWVTDKIEVQIVLGYRGLIDLARRSGQIVSIAAQAVYENDHFEYAYGLDEKLEHRPAMGERGNIIAFYAVAKLAGGGHAFEVMSNADVQRIRDASQGWQQAVRAKKQDMSPWGAHYAEMGRKTVLRRLFKYLPVSIELANAASLDELNARGESQALDNVLEGNYITPAPDDGDGDDDAPPQIAYDPAPILQAITAAADVEALDLIADQMRDAPDEHYDALKAAYDRRRAELQPE